MCVSAAMEASLKCIRPILFEDSQSVDFPYYSHPGGTGFLVRFGQRVYFIMASHCLPAERNVNDLRIFVALGRSVSFLPLRELRTPKTHDGQDHAHIDFLIIAAAVDRLSPPDQSILFPLELGEDRFARPTDDGVVSLFVRGYPGELSEIDYSRKKQRYKALLARVTNPARSTLNAGTFTVHLDYKKHIKSPGGMSGSPALALVRRPNGTSEICLAGMVITAGDDSLTLIGGNIFQEALWQAVSSA